MKLKHGHHEDCKLTSVASGWVRPSSALEAETAELHIENQRLRTKLEVAMSKTPLSFFGNNIVGCRPPTPLGEQAEKQLRRQQELMAKRLEQEKDAADQKPLEISRPSVVKDAARAPQSVRAVRESNVRRCSSPVQLLSPRGCRLPLTSSVQTRAEKELRRAHIDALPHVHKDIEDDCDLSRAASKDSICGLGEHADERLRRSSSDSSLTSRGYLPSRRPASGSRLASPAARRLRFSSNLQDKAEEDVRRNQADFAEQFHRAFNSGAEDDFRCAHIEMYFDGKEDSDAPRAASKDQGPRRTSPELSLTLTSRRSHSACATRASPSGKKNRKAVFFAPFNTVHEVTPYSQIYGEHPRFFNFDRKGAMKLTDRGVAEEMRRAGEMLATM